MATSKVLGKLKICSGIVVTVRAFSLTVIFSLLYLSTKKIKGKTIKSALVSCLKLGYGPMASN